MLDGFFVLLSTIAAMFLLIKWSPQKTADGVEVHGNGPRSTRLLDDDIGRKPILGKPVDGKRANDGYRCELCGAWIEIPRPWQSAAHEDPLPHRSNDRKQQNPPQGAI
jgi:hypothetical protein